MNDTEAAKLVTIAIASCPTQGGRLSQSQVADMVSAWAMLLEDVAYDEGAAALKRYLATSKWLPSPAEIRSIVAESTHGRQRPGGEAWGDVLRAVGRFGSYREPVFDDPIVASAVASLGWREICLSENQAADRARFVDLYDRLAARHAEDLRVGALPGAAVPALATGRPVPVRHLLGDVIRRIK